MNADTEAGARLILGREGLRQLMHRLADDGREVIGPTVQGDAVVLASIRDPDDLPTGMTTEQDAGRYRLLDGSRGSGETGPAFAYAVPAQPWKRYLYPSAQRLARLRREEDGFLVEPQAEAPAPAYALFGMRPCDLNALRALDAALGAHGAADVRYVRRRERGLVVVVNCTRSSASCFCASMQTGPQAEAGYDIAMTELGEDGEDIRYVVTSASLRGAALLKDLPTRPATAEDLAEEASAIARARASQQRSMLPDAAGLLARNLEHRHWDEVARRCLGCGNCTLACPTCFCSTVEDTTSLAGDTAERWRKWDSCFNPDFSFMHGGSIRGSVAARYRQWITHKLSFWWQQFGMSGCVGCGRCITWCPVGIDITQEVRALHDSERALHDSEGVTDR